MFSLERSNSLDELIQTSRGNVNLFLKESESPEEDPKMLGYADFGVPWWPACQDKHGKEDVENYKHHVQQTDGAAWMDNTTLATARALMSDGGSEVMTPLTVWDLVTFARAVVCFERIYHHAHRKP